MYASNGANVAIENMLSRRSVRSYTAQQVKHEDLECLLCCALYAPNGGGLQLPRFLVIRNAQMLEHLNAVVQSELASRSSEEGSMMSKGVRRARRSGYHFIYHAPMLISAVAPRTADNAMADCACALENILLAAEACSLGACWSNQAHWLTAVPAIRAIFAEAGLRPDEDIFGSVAVGYAAETDRTVAARKPGRVVLDGVPIEVQMPF